MSRWLFFGWPFLLLIFLCSFNCVRFLLLLFFSLLRVLRPPTANVEFLFLPWILPIASLDFKDLLLCPHSNDDISFHYHGHSSLVAAYGLHIFSNPFAFNLFLCLKCISHEEYSLGLNFFFSSDNHSLWFRVLFYRVLAPMFCDEKSDVFGIIL